MTRTIILLVSLFLPVLGFAQSTEWEAPLRASLNKMADTLSSTLKPWTVPDRIFLASEFGAVADGKTVNTLAMQKAIDACASAGGGVVLVKGGTYVTGTLVLKSGVMLEIAEGSTLLGSLNLSDYPDHVPARLTVMDTWMKMKQSLIYAEACDRIGIRGKGVIDGRGTQKNFPGNNTTAETPGRPFLIRILDCRKVVIDGISLRNPACWTQNYLGCEDLIIQGVQVHSQVNWNNDGIDIDSCRNVIVRDCFINSHDDGLCFKGAGLRTMENVLVENCTIYSSCNAIKFGTDSQGDFRNVVIRNVEIGGPPATAEVYQRTKGISGISWQSVDGGTVENILVHGVKMDRTKSPFCLRLGDRGRVKPDMKRPAPGSLRRLIFEDISGGESMGSRGSIISGVPGAIVRDVIFRNVTIGVGGGGDAKDASRAVPELVAAYPDAYSFGEKVPASGFWIRHASGITFDRVILTVNKPDARPLFLVGIDSADIAITPAIRNDGR